MQRKIKIGHVSVFYPPDGGGGELYLERMVKALGKFEHHVWTTTGLEKIVGERSGPNCFFEVFGSSPTTDVSFWLDWFEENHLEIFQSIRRWLKKVQCDVLIINNWFAYFPQSLAFMESLQNDLPVGFIRHDIPIYPFEFLLKEYELTQNWEESFRKVRPHLTKFAQGEIPGVMASPFCHNYDFTIYNSECAKAFIDPQGEKNHIVFHPLISRTHELPERGLKPVDFTIVNPLPNKGGAVFIALALFHFRDRKFRILAGGYNSAMAKLRPFIYSMGSSFFPPRLPENIEVLGYIENMSEVYRNTQVLLHPTRIDSYGMTAVEAVFENCLVATTDIPGVVEGVGDAALKIPYFAKPREWADKISAALEQRQYWREKMEQRTAFIKNRQAEEITALEQFLESFAKREPRRNR